MEWEQQLLDGAPDVDARRALLDYLAEQGHDLELMRDAAAAGRLYALAGDQHIRPGRMTLRFDDLAQRLGEDVDWVRRLWRALGLVEPLPDGRVATEAEVEALAVWPLLRQILGDEQALELARVHGSAVARVAEAVAATMTYVVPDIDLARSGDEVTTARAFAAVTELVPQATRSIEMLYRQHLGTAALHLESAHVPTGFGLQPSPYCIGFADLCGFTAATERLTAAELTTLLSVFESAAFDEAADGGGRCVKLIGDAAMFVAASPDALAEIAHRLVTRMAAASDVLPVRVAMAAGDVVVRGGDYFGPSVNLAARLLGLAEPGTVLADARLAQRLDPDRWQLLAQEAQAVKGVADLVVPQQVLRAGSAVRPRPRSRSGHGS